MTDRDLILRKLVPGFLNTDAGDPTQDTRKMLDTLQGGLDTLLDLIDEFALSFDPDRANEKCIDLMLISGGNPFASAYSLPLTQKRKLVKLLVTIYLEKGTTRGIENACRLLTGKDVRVVFPPTVDAWILDVSVLGDGSPPTTPGISDHAVLGQSYAYTVRSFQLQVDETLTQDERDVLTDIVLIMKPLNTHFVGIIEPDPGAEILHWELDFSDLGVNTDLH